MGDLRSLVTGADGCSAGDGAGPSNAAASLADALLGRRAKQQAQLQEVRGGGGGGMQAATVGRCCFSCCPRPSCCTYAVHHPCPPAPPSCPPPQLPGLHAPGPSASLQPFRPPTAAQAAEAALAAELPAVAGLGPAAAATQADVDAFLRGLPGAAAPPADFSEFDSIYAAQRPQLPGMPPPPPMAMEGRAAAAPMLQVWCWLLGFLSEWRGHAFWGANAARHRCWRDGCHFACNACRPWPRHPLAARQAFLDSSKARAPFHPGLAPPPPPGAALSLADQCRVRDRSTIMARQLFAEQGAAFAGGARRERDAAAGWAGVAGPASKGRLLLRPSAECFLGTSWEAWQGEHAPLTLMHNLLSPRRCSLPCADEQVGRLLAALNISPVELPAEGPGLAANWDRIYAAAASRVAPPSAAAEHAASVAMASAAQQHQQQQWAQEFERLRLGEAGPSSSGAWAAEYQQQQPQQQPAGWADEFAAAEGVESVAEGTNWVNEFRSTAAAGSAMRQQAAGDALEQTRKLADTLAGAGCVGFGCHAHEAIHACCAVHACLHVHAGKQCFFVLPAARRRPTAAHPPPPLMCASPRPTLCPVPQPAATPRSAAPSSCSLCPR